MRHRVATTALAALLTAAFGVGLLVPAPPAEAASITAKALLGKLTVKAESNSGYDRNAYFGQWIDADKDCQNTRAEVLIKESTVSTVTFTTARNCTLATGTWVSRFDGLTHTKASDVQIDHHVPVHEAWGSGAKGWTQTQRVAFYNDLYAPTLNAMTSSMNSSKQARDPAEWLPPKNRCTYAIWWVQVKYRWKLSIDPAEKAALSTVLSGTCGDKSVTIPTIALK